VRFLPSKSKGVETAILLGSGVTAGKPCLERVLSLCFFSFFTFWVTSWKSAREALTSLPLCFTTGFPGSPKGSLPQHLFSTSNAVHRSGVRERNAPAGGRAPRAHGHTCQSRLSYAPVPTLGLCESKSCGCSVM